MHMFSAPRALVSAGAAALALLVLGACAPDRTTPPCPNVRVDSATANVTQFREGPGRAVGDIVYQAEIVNYKGTCTQDLDKNNLEGEAEVDMEIEFAMATGAASAAGEIPLYYFIDRKSVV